MKNFKYKTRAGIEVELDDIDMDIIYRYYAIQNTADYLRENHEDWLEDKVQIIAYETRRQMFDYNYDEDYAIEEAIRTYRGK